MSGSLTRVPRLTVARLRGSRRSSMRPGSSSKSAPSHAERRRPGFSSLSGRSPQATASRWITCRARAGLLRRGPLRAACLAAGGDGRRQRRRERTRAWGCSGQDCASSRTNTPACGVERSVVYRCRRTGIGCRGRARRSLSRIVAEHGRLASVAGEAGRRTAGPRARRTSAGARVRGRFVKGVGMTVPPRLVCRTYPWGRRGLAGRRVRRFAGGTGRLAERGAGVDQGVGDEVGAGIPDLRGVLSSRSSRRVDGA